MKAKKKKKDRSKGGGLSLRAELRVTSGYLNEAMKSLGYAFELAEEAGATDQIAIAAAALKTIANSTDSDPRSKGVAAAALKKAGIQ